MSGLLIVRPECLRRHLKGGWRAGNAHRIPRRDDGRAATSSHPVLHGRVCGCSGAEADMDRSKHALLEYHERSKHRLDCYAPGPGRLDWTTQPDPFRVFHGAPRVDLPLAADTLATCY